jgi:RNA polymerase sigma factor (sigma-70 family)
MEAGFLELTESDLRAQMLWLRRLAARLVRGERDADDAVQDTLVAALEHPPALDRDVRPWLARVLANFTRSEHRSDGRRRQRETAASRGDVAETPGADDLLVRHEAARVVAGLVSGLREPHRTLVLLRFAEGLTPKEIAGRRSVPEGTVRRQLKEALDQLRADVARHYERDARDWRMALAPLLRVPAEEAALAGAWKGVLLMTVKSKVVLGVGAAALLLVLLLALVRGPSPSAGGDPEGAMPSTAAGLETTAGGSAAAHPSGAAPRRPSAPTPTAAAPPPSFAAAAAPADPARCEEKLAELRALASRRGVVSPAAFHRAQPSPRTERKVAPIVERVLGKLPDKPAYQLECRASVCRVGAVADPAAGNAPPPWLRILGQDPDFAALRGPNQTGHAESVGTKDALSGAPMRQHWIYFNVPMDSVEEHPFEAAAGASTCGERVAAVQKGLDEQRDLDQRRRKDDAERQQRFQTSAVNPELTKRIQAAFRALPIGAPGAAAAGWECRGQADCRWRGPANLMRSLEPGRLSEALASQGLHAGDVTARVKKDGSGGEGEAEVSLSLEDGKKARRAAAGAAGPNSQVVHVEKVSTERAPE